MSSWFQNVVDGSRRLKEEILQNAGVYGAGTIDPVFETRHQRFLQHSVAMDRLCNATSNYLNHLDALSIASTQLVHEFSSYFNMQMTTGGSQSSENDQLVKQLYQAAQCLEGIQLQLKSSVFDKTNQMIKERVLKPLVIERREAAEVQKTIQIRRQKILDYDSLKRAADTKKVSQDYKQKLNFAEETLYAITSEINESFDKLEAHRGYFLRKELLAVTACQVHTANTSYHYFQQMLPIMPGISLRLSELYDAGQDYKEPKPSTDPTTADLLGIFDYTGTKASSTIIKPVDDMNFISTEDINVTRIDLNASFEKMHVACQLVQDIYHKQ